MNTVQSILDYAKLNGISLQPKDGRIEIDGPKETLTPEFINAAKKHKSELIETLDQPERWNPELSAQGYQWCFDCIHWNGQCTSQDNPYAAVEKQPQCPRICKWYEAKE